MKKPVLTKIKKLKNRVFGQVVVAGRMGRQPFILKLLTHSIIDDSSIIALLSRWRKKHEKWFSVQFPVSEERTRKWLSDKVINELDRLLFMVDINGKYFGHVGLYRFDFEKNICEIDNIVRGEEGYPGLMTAAVKILMEWGRNELDLVNFALQTTSDNSRALRFYERLGFTETKRTPLIYSKANEGGEWREAPKDYKGKIDRYNVMMRLK